MPWKLPCLGQSIGNSGLYNRHEHCTCLSGVNVFTTGRLVQQLTSGVADRIESDSKNLT